MPGWAASFPVVGSQAPSLTIASTEQKHPLGSRLLAFDTNGAFGGGEFVYGKSVPAIVSTGRLVMPDFDGTMIDVPSAVMQGFPVAAAMGPMAANTFGWFQLSGLMVLSAAQSVAIGVAVGVNAVGQAGTNAAGKQLLGGRVSQPSTYNVVKANSTAKNGTKQIYVNDCTWLVPGLVVSGAGVAGGTKIVSIDSSGTLINVDTNTTAAIAGPVTFTYTGFLIVSAPNGLTAQGAIT